MLSDLVYRFRALFRRSTVEAEMNDELRFHFEQEVNKHEQSGLPHEEAVRRARLRFGGMELTKEECRDSRRITFLSHVIQDLHYAMRMARRAPGFTALIIFMLAIGMGANLATFSVTDAILLRMLPVRDPASLFRMVRATGNASDAGSVGCSYPLYLEMQKRDRALADLMAYQAADAAPVSIGRTEPERLTQQTVSGNYFQVLGIRALAGRLVSPGDNSEPGQHPVAVISYTVWNRRFAKSERAIGSKLEFDGHVFDIIGIAPPNFFGVEVGKKVDIWTPIAMAPAENLRNDHLFWLRLMGRVNPGVTLAQAAAPIQAAMNEAMLEDVRQHAPPGTPRQIINQFLAGMRIKGVPAGGGISYLRRQYQQPLEIMLFVVGLVLLIACSNVANLLIAKGSVRQQELAIRTSLGAGRARILQQLITESVLLAASAAIGGLLVTHWATPVLVGLLAPSTQPAKLATGIDLRLIAFTAFLTFATVLICGLLPAIRLARTDMHTALKSGARLAGIGTGGVRRILVASQVALSLILIVGAGLFTRTLVNLMSSYLGFRPGHVLVSTITYRHAPDAERVRTGWSGLLRRVRELPGVEQASLSSAGLFAGDPPLLGVRTTATKPLPTPPITGVLFVSTHYFETLGIGVLHGRDFVPRDNDPGGPASIIVNEAFAHKFFGGENPLGHQLTKLANTPMWTEIVGIAEDAKYSSLRADPPPMIYVPYGHIANWLDPHAHPGESMVLQVRGHQSETLLASELRHDEGEQFIIGEVFRQQQLIDDSLVRERLLASIGNVFGALALLLAATGLYGVMNYAAVQRRKELGVRIALGAAPKTILALMLRDSAAIAAIGAAIGVLASIFATRLVRALLFGLVPNDPITFIAASVVLLSVSLLAAFIPAYRAARTDPMVALRHE